MSESLQLRVMGGHEGGDAACEQVREDGTRQGGALLRVRARAEFIQDHQRTLVGFLQDMDDVGDVAGEGGEGLLDGLLVADVRVDGGKAGQFRAGLGRDVQPALRHGGQQANRLKCDRLAAGVGAGDDHCECAGERVNIGGYHRFRVQQWMAGVDQSDR